MSVNKQFTQAALKVANHYDLDAKDLADTFQDKSNELYDVVTFINAIEQSNKDGALPMLLINGIGLTGGLISIPILLLLNTQVGPLKNHLLSRKMRKEICKEINEFKLNRNEPQ